MTVNPYHAEVIGSLLRPEHLKEAYRRFDAGEIPESELTAAQDRGALDALALYDATGVDIVTDGEVRRRGWTDPLTRSVSGFGPAPVLQVNWHDSPERSELIPPGTQKSPLAPGTAVIARIGRAAINLPLVEVQFIKAHTNRPFKLTMPSLAHASVLWSPGKSDEVYPDRKQFMADVLEAAAGIVQECIEAGASYIQMDSPRYTHLVSEDGLSNFKQLGIDPHQWMGEMITWENALVDRFPQVTWALHLCRGNGRRGAWAVAGGYDPIAEQLFNTIHVDRLMLEYDTPRAGTFAPLRFFPQDKVAVLGLVSTKEREVETPELLKRRLDEASQYIDLERISLSPQCGFASAFEGNVTEEIQRAKLETLSRVARDVWGR